MNGIGRNPDNAVYDGKEVSLLMEGDQEPSVSLIYALGTYALPKAIYFGRRMRTTPSSLFMEHTLLVGHEWCTTDGKDKKDYPQFS